MKKERPPTAGGVEVVNLFNHDKSVLIVGISNHYIDINSYSYQTTKNIIANLLDILQSIELGSKK